jgi:hypothetical protein
LGVGKSSKVTQLDQGRLPRVLRFQPVQRFVQSQDIHARALGGWFDLNKFEAIPVAPGLLTMFVTRNLDQNPPHRFRCGGKEMATRIPVLSLLDIHEPDVGVMDQRRRLQRLARLLVCELRSRQPA